MESASPHRLVRKAPPICVDAPSHSTPKRLIAAASALSLSAILMGRILGRGEPLCHLRRVPGVEHLLARHFVKTHRPLDC